MGMHCAAGRVAPDAAESGAALQGGPDLCMIETVECVVSLHRSYEDKSRCLGPFQSTLTRDPWIACSNT